MLVERVKKKYAAFTDFFDKNGNYKLASQLESSYKSSLPNQFEKDFIDVDRKINLLFSALDGKILKYFQFQMMLVINGFFFRNKC